jgi:hypothetical protein
MVKIATDSLTFVNTSRIKEGLNRLEKYGTFKAHPSEKRTRFPEDNVNVIFDFHVVTKIDPRSRNPPSPKRNPTFTHPLNSSKADFWVSVTRGQKSTLSVFQTASKKLLPERKSGSC